MGNEDFTSTVGLGDGGEGPDAGVPALQAALRQEAERRAEAEDLTAIIHAFLQLFTQKLTLHEYLESAVRLVEEWSSCRHVGIRVLNQLREIPYMAHAGLSEEFCARESHLSLDRDTCACVRVAIGHPDPQDVPLLTSAGSFVCNDTDAFLSSLTIEEQRRFRGVCVEAGFHSLAVIPIHHFDAILGAVQIADENPNCITARVVRLVETMAPLIGEAIHRFHIEQELLKIEKLESLGLLAGGIAHDFNNLLTGILGHISLARARAEDGGDVRPLLAAAERGVERSQLLAEQLLTFADGRHPAPRAGALPGLIADVLDFAFVCNSSGYEVELAADLWVAEYDPGQISRVLQNLIMNAQQAMPAGGTVRVRAQNVILPEGNVMSLPSGPFVRIDISDEGTGISAENRSRIFEPYFTTKPTGKGLGLPTSYAIVRHHGGSIAVESTLGIGSTFFVYLPAAKGDGQAVELAPAHAVADHGLRILLMDDDEVVRQTMAEMARYFGHDVEAVADGEAAVQAFGRAQQAGRPFDIVLLDLAVPAGTGGAECLLRLRELDPGVPAIASSGDQLAPIMLAPHEHGFAAAVAKPVTLSALARKLEAVGRAAPEPAAMRAPAQRRSTSRREPAPAVSARSTNGQS